MGPQVVEIFGPPCYDIWESSHAIFSTGSKMLRHIDNCHVERYRNKVASYDRQYSGCWATMRQADARMILERPQRLLERAEEDYEFARANNWRATFDPLRPWNEVWHLMVEGDEPWWTSTWLSLVT